MAVNWQRTMMRVWGAHEFPVTVTSIEDVATSYRRIGFDAGEFFVGRELYPTAWIRLWVPALDNPEHLQQRGYTLVDPDPATKRFSLEFVIHEPLGPAASWALGAKVGDVVEIAMTPAKLMPDTGLGKFVLLGDASALAAINSLLDYLPSTTSTTVVFLAHGDDADQLPFRLHDGVELRFVGSGAEQLAVLRELNLDPADSYVWAAGERKDVAAIRQHIRNELRLPRQQQHTQYHWIEGKPFG